MNQSDFADSLNEDIQPLNHLVPHTGPLNSNPHTCVDDKYSVAIHESTATQFTSTQSLNLSKTTVFQKPSPIMKIKLNFRSIDNSHSHTRDILSISNSSYSTPKITNTSSTNDKKPIFKLKLKPLINKVKISELPKNDDGSLLTPNIPPLKKIKTTNNSILQERSRLHSSGSPKEEIVISPLNLSKQDESSVSLDVIKSSNKDDSELENSINLQYQELVDVLNFNFGCQFLTPYLTKVLKKLFRKDFYAMFWEPVNLNEVTDYLSIVKSPMDLSTMRSKITSNSYSSLSLFANDFKLICDNAMIYNSPSTVYYQHAKKLYLSGSNSILRTARKLSKNITSYPKKISHDKSAQINSETSAVNPLQDSQDNSNDSNLIVDITEVPKNLYTSFNNKSINSKNFSDFQNISKPIIPIFKIKSSSPMFSKKNIRTRGPGKATLHNRRFSDHHNIINTNPDGSLSVQPSNLNHFLNINNNIKAPVMLLNSSKPLLSCEDWRQAQQLDYFNFPIVANLKNTVNLPPHNPTKPTFTPSLYSANFPPLTQCLTGGDVGLAYYLSLIRFIGDTNSDLLLDYMKTVLSYLSNRVYDLIFTLTKISNLYSNEKSKPFNMNFIPTDKFTSNPNFDHLGLTVSSLIDVYNWISYSDDLIDVNDHLLKFNTTFGIPNIDDMKSDFCLSSPSDINVGISDNSYSISNSPEDIFDELSKISTVLMECTNIDILKNDKLQTAKDSITNLISFLSKSS
ncbi:Bromodomain-containing protein 9 [Smittium culicis]|uniref:Bromodomain-containing protein 9 n=1 Tax=Smittium culicis TaxID=133412 RepID=A0A1R1XKE5_9FUNG|nr:Bromodomain-containing protein 9 [Smittium culicis]